MSIKAVVLDLGMLIDPFSRNSLHSLRSAFLSFGYPVRESHLQMYDGLSRPAMVRNVLSDFFRETEPQVPHPRPVAVTPILREFQAQHFRYLQYGIMVSPLVREVFQYLHHSKIPVGLTSEYTAGEITYVSNILAKAGLSIGPIVGSNDVEHSRPHPDMTLKVAQELGIEELDMSQVIKVDRSLYGLSEGFRAGCRTVGVADLSCMANNRYFPAPLYTSMSSNVAISRYRLNDIKRTMMDAGHIAITDLGELPPLLEDM